MSHIAQRKAPLLQEALNTLRASSKMPPSKSKMTNKSGGKSAKAVRAEKLGAEAVQEALRKMDLGHAEVPEFYSVQKVLGNGYFLIRNAAGKEYQGAGGHGGGKARISVGQIVLADYSATPALPREIRAVIDDRKQAAALVKSGFMAASVVNAAMGAGSVSTGGAPVEEEGYVFAEPEAEDDDAEVDVNAL
jgi:hypothetical protein